MSSLLQSAVQRELTFDQVYRDQPLRGFRVQTGNIIDHSLQTWSKLEIKLFTLFVLACPTNLTGVYHTVPTFVPYPSKFTRTKMVSLLEEADPSGHIVSILCIYTRWTIICYTQAVMCSQRKRACVYIRDRLSTAKDSKQFKHGNFWDTQQICVSTYSQLT